MSTELLTRTMTAALALGAVVWLAPGPLCCPTAGADASPTLAASSGTASRPQTGGSAPPVQLAPGVAAGLAPKTKFDPNVHGFEFTNYFTGDILVDLPVIGRVDLGDTTYGLCGGMVFSALDTLKLGATAPDVPTTPPVSGTPIRSYVYERQRDSLKYDNWFLVQKLIKWMRKPLKDQTVSNPLAQGGQNVIERGLITLSERQFKKRIRPALDEGRPVPIVLVKADGEDMVKNPKAAFSKNHQVLAIGYRKHGDDWQIDIYDPNFPNTIQTLHTDGRYQTEQGKPAHTGQFRGFFRSPYKLDRPPWVQDSQTVADRIKRSPSEHLGKPESDDCAGEPAGQVFMKSGMTTRLSWIGLVALLLILAPIERPPNCCYLVHAATPQPTSSAQSSAKEVKPAAPRQSSPAVAIPGAVTQRVVDWFARNGGSLHVSTDANRPVILLVHGLHSSARAWMSPGNDPAVGGYYYDHRHAPPREKLKKSYPGVGIYKEGKSERSGKEVNDNNWFHYLTEKNFTVASWDQPGEKFAEAYESAEKAFEELLKATTGPIALVGHSRGGLVIRKLLKEKILKQNVGAGRVRWVITLHSPHTGSELAKGPEILLDEVGLKCKQIPNVPDKWLPNARKMCNELLDSLAKRLAKPGSLELAPGGPILGPLAEGEAPVPGVSYYTFGGTSPTYIRYYLWYFTAGSAVPQYKCDPAPTNCKQYFKWEAVPKQISAISPMYDAVRDVVPEIKPGAGDGLVADARARLPFATHATNKLNHAEVLWSRPVQQRVVQLLSSSPPLKTGRP